MPAVTFIIVLLAVPAFGIALRMGFKLLYGARGPRRGDAFYTLGMVVSTVLTFAGFLAPALPLAVAFGLPLLGLLGFAFIQWLLSRRELQRRAIWSLLQRTQASQAPLPETLALHTSRFRGVVGSAFQGMLFMLERGSALNASLHAFPDCIPRDARGAAALAGDGPLPEDRRLMGAQPAAIDAMWARVTQTLGYTAFLTLFAAVILTGMMIFIVPSFRQIFDEFGLELPRMTLLLIHVSDWVSQSGVGVLLGSLLVLVVGGLLLSALLYALNVAVFQWLFDRLMWFRHRAQVLLLMAEAADRGMPFYKVCDRLADGYPSYACGLVRRRLRRARRRVADGVDWVDALYSSWLIRRCDIAALETAHAAGNLPWVLRRIADENLQQGLYRFRLIEQTLLPALLMAFSLFVGWVCVSLFLPLVSLINNLV